MAAEQQQLGGGGGGGGVDGGGGGVDGGGGGVGGGGGCADLRGRAAAMDVACCDEAGEDCSSSGRPATCNAGAVLWAGWLRCAP